MEESKENFERWAKMVEIYCAALEEFLRKLTEEAWTPQSPGELLVTLRGIAEAPLRKLENRMDALKEKYEKEEGQ